jgi:hypothetical protein
MTREEAIKRILNMAIFNYGEYHGYSASDDLDHEAIMMISKEVDNDPTQAIENDTMSS